MTTLQPGTLCYLVRVTGMQELAGGVLLPGFSKCSAIARYCASAPAAADYTTGDSTEEETAEATH